jgi:dipeptidyl-peptidase-4
METALRPTARHSARLINALIKAQKHYELLLFPDERHV